MICENCGREAGDGRYCVYCGAEQSSWKAEHANGGDASSSNTVGTNLAVRDAQSSTASGNDGSRAGNKSGMTRNQKLLAINGTICAVLVVFIAIGLGTAVHWTKVDVPEHPETFHTEQRDTGTYAVWLDSSKGENVCYVGEDWNSCINRLVDQYNNACAGHTIIDTEGLNDSVVKSLSIAELHNDKIAENWALVSSHNVCTTYSDQIDWMKQQAGRDGEYEVASLGDYWMYLTSAKVLANVQVSNNDYYPAVTHEAVCYFGFIGECDYPEDGQ